MSVTIYRYDDLEAPNLNPVKHGINIVIKACLESGYGSKAGAGWSTVYEDADRGLLLMKNAGSQRYYLFRHDGVVFQTDSDGQSLGGFTARGAASALSLDSLVGLFPRVGLDANSQIPDLTGIPVQFVTHSNGLTAPVAGNYAWAIVADDKTAMLFFSGATTGANLFDSPRFLLCGDANLLGANTIALPSAIIYGNTYYSVGSSSGILDLTSVFIFLERSIGGGSTAVRSRIDEFMPTSDISGGGNVANVLPYPNPYLGGLTKLPIYIAEYLSDPQREVTFEATKESQLIFATLRGIYETPHAVSTSATYSAIKLGNPGAIVTSDGRDYLLLRRLYTGTTSEKYMVLDLTGPW